MNLFLSGFISSLPQLAWEKRLVVVVVVNQLQVSAWMPITRFIRNETHALIIPDGTVATRNYMTIDQMFATCQAWQKQTVKEKHDSVLDSSLKKMK